VYTRSGAGALGVIVETAREALAKAAEFLEEGQGGDLQGLLGNVLHRAVVVTMAEIEDQPRRTKGPPPPMTFRIGIISDTHRLLRPQAERRLAGVDHIIHGGDIGRPEIIDELRRISPVTAIRGNVDIDDGAVAYPETEVVRLAGKAIYVLHDLMKARNAGSSVAAGETS
jgi:hypothetical protein